MPFLTDYLSRRGEYLVLVLTVGASIFLMMLSKNDKVAVAHAISDTALTPVQAALTEWQSIVGAREENRELREELVRQSLALMRMNEQQRQNDRLRELLEYRQDVPWDFVPARVIAREARRKSAELKINRGSAHGLEKNQAVVTSDGLVGKITRVGPNSAFVRPIEARYCNVSVRLTRTRTDAILEWIPEVGLHLTFLPFRAEVAIGDAVLTSGLGEVFPEGIAVAQVSDVETLADGSLQVLVKPRVDSRSIEEVFVVRKAIGGHDREVTPEDQAIALPDSPSERS